MPLNLIPKKRQWSNWTLPSKLTAIGTVVGILSLIVALLAMLPMRHSLRIDNELVHRIESPHLREIDKLNSQVRSYQNGLASFETTYRNIGRLVSSHDIAIAFLKDNEPTIYSDISNDVKALELKEIKRIIALSVFGPDLSEHLRRYVELVQDTEVSSDLKEFESAQNEKVLEVTKKLKAAKDAGVDTETRVNMLIDFLDESNDSYEKLSTSQKASNLTKYYELFDVVEIILEIGEEQDEFERKRIIDSIENNWVRTKILNYVKYDQEISSYIPATEIAYKELSCSTLLPGEHTFRKSDIDRRYAYLVCQDKLEEVEQISAPTSFDDCLVADFIHNDHSCVSEHLESFENLFIALARSSVTIQEDDFSYWIHMIHNDNLSDRQVGRFVRIMMKERVELLLLETTGRTAVCAEVATLSEEEGEEYIKLVNAAFQLKIDSCE